MKLEDKKFLSELLSKLKNIDYIRPEDIPNIDLYMDQVTTFMDDQLASLKRFEDDKMLTKTMINNYTKNHVLPPPVKKKYSKDHMYMLIYIYYLKNMLSISDIKEIVNPLADKFFNIDKDINLTEIYDKIFNMENANSIHMVKDILGKYRFATESFDDIKDENDKDFLVKFAFICLLGFDVYIKKTMIEQLIDESVLRKYVDKEKNDE
jgi:hypothetical protein